jgi:rhodanese-related sulfurtransferase
MTHREFKDPLYAQFARIGRALASPQRLELLDLLGQGERSVEALAREASLPIANASQHLQALHRARLVERRKDGQRVFYRLASPDVFELWRAVRTIGERHLAEIDRLVALYLEDPNQLEALGREELLGRLASGDVTLLDARPADEYRQGHIPGALSIPVDELESRLADLPREREVIAYCRGPYCLFSREAATILTAHGFHARRLGDGFPEWRAAGLPVAVGDD